MTDNLKKDYMLARVIMPSELLFEGKVTMVNLPTEDGIIGILPGHASLVVSVVTGVASIFSGTVESKLFIHDGVAYINANEVNIISELAALLADVEKSDIEEKILALEERKRLNPNDVATNKVIDITIGKYKALLSVLK